MKFKLVEKFDNEMHTNSSNITLNEGYEILWKQFEQVLGVSKNNYDLHHIYNDASSKNGGHINFLLLPQTLHKRFPRNSINNRDDAVKVYKYLKQEYPESFKQIKVTFEVFTPQDINSIGNKMSDINRLRRNSRRNKYKKPSVDDILKQSTESKKELTTV